MATWMLFTSVFGFWFSNGCNLDQLQSQFQQAANSLPAKLQERYATSWEIDVVAARDYMNKLISLRACQREQQKPLEPCNFVAELSYDIGFGNSIGRHFDFYEQGARCTFDKDGIEYIVGPLGAVTYGNERVWSLSPWHTLYCESAELKRTRRQWVITGHHPGIAAGLFVIDFSLPDHGDLPNSMFWGRKIFMTSNADMSIQSVNAKRIRFSWPNQAFVEINSADGAITDSNFIASSMYSAGCVTRKENSHFIPQVELEASGLGMIEKVEDIAQ